MTCTMLRACATALALLLPAAGAQAAGGLLLSDQDRSLAIGAWGGAASGATLRLYKGCSERNPDCLWTYRGGMLISDRDTALAMRPQRVVNGAEIVLDAQCSRGRADCRWTYRDGMFVSDADPALAIRATGGARYGTTLRLSGDCRPKYPDCTWSRPTVFEATRGMK